uniref:Peripheral myelin protein 22-like n=1 Tax=Cyprinus carpio TaxID=7962 RepID=A0A8C2GGZ7_CYPCA
MLAILLATIVLHLTDLIILFISTCANAWRTDGVANYDLWYDCTQRNGGYNCRGTNDADWLQAVQALMVLATIFCLISFIFFLCQLFTLVKGGRFFFTAVFQVLASEYFLSRVLSQLKDPVYRFLFFLFLSPEGLFVMSGAIIYTVMSPEWKNENDTYGYAFVLAWLAFPLTLISGFIYIVLRKKE